MAEEGTHIEGEGEQRREVAGERKPFAASGADGSRGTPIPGTVVLVLDNQKIVANLGDGAVHGFQGLFEIVQLLPAALEENQVGILGGLDILFIEGRRKPGDEFLGGDESQSYRVALRRPVGHIQPFPEPALLLRGHENQNTPGPGHRLQGHRIQFPRQNTRHPPGLQIVQIQANPASPLPGPIQ